MSDGEIRTAPLLMEHLPLRVIERKDGIFKVATEFTDIHLNAVGAVHGGVIAMLLDIGVAGGGSTGVNDGVGTYGVTLSLTVSFVATAGPGPVICEGRVTGGGARTKFADARILDAEGRTVATATGVVKVIDYPGDV